MHNTQVQEFAEAIGAGAEHHRRRSAVLGGGEQGEALPADQAGHRPRAAARVDARARDRGALRQGVRRAARVRLRAVRRGARPVHAGVGVSRDRASSRRSFARPRARWRATGRPRSCIPAATPPGTETTRSAAAGDCAAERAARKLGTQGRLLHAGVSMDVPGYPYPPYPKSAKGKVDNPGGKYPFAHEAITTGIREATITGAAVPDQGLVRLRHQPDHRAAERGRDHQGHPEPRPAGGRRRDSERDRGLGRRRAAGVDLSRTVRRPERRSCSASPSSRCASRSSRRRTTRSRTGGLRASSRRSWASVRTIPWKTIEEYLDHRLTKAGLSFAELKQKGIIHGRPQPIYFEEGVAPEFPTPSGKIEFYSTPAPRQGIRSGAEVHAAGGPPPGIVPAAVRPGAGALVQPHAVQSDPARHDGRERGLAERRRGRADGPRRRATTSG